MGARLPLLPSCFNLLRVSFAQVDRGADNEHEGDGVEMLIVTFSICVPSSCLQSILLTSPFPHKHCSVHESEGLRPLLTEDNVKLKISVDMYYIQRVRHVVES
jgi:hypothetical protein